MSPRRSEQWAEIRHEKRGKILSTALELFASKGYHGTTISQIAGKAGISKGLMYNYFSGKQELLTEILTAGMSELLQDLQLVEGEGITPENLRKYVDTTFRKLEENPRFYQLFFSLIIQPQVLTLFREEFVERIMPLMGMLEKLFRRSGEADARARAYLFIALLDGIGMDYIALGGDYPLNEVKRTFINMFLQNEEEDREES